MLRSLAAISLGIAHAAAAAGDRGNRLHRMVDRNIQLQIPAPRAGDVKAADVGELGIQRLDDALRLARFPRKPSDAQAKVDIPGCVAQMIPRKVGKMRSAPI